MQLTGTSKFILLAAALVHGGIAASALSVKESSNTARSVEYAHSNAREFDDMELFVRDASSFFGPKFGRSSHALNSTSLDTPGSKARTRARGSKVRTRARGSKVRTRARRPRYNPRPTMDVASRRKFRKFASQNSALLKKAAKDKNHPFHSTAVHMKREAALRKKYSGRKAVFRAALRDKNHPLHVPAMVHRNKQQNKAIRNAQTENPKLVETALADKNHPLHKAAHRVAAQDNVAGFNALPFGS